MKLPPLKRPRMTEKLPGVLVTLELYQQVVEFAEQQDVSQSEVIRAALVFYLSENASKTQNDTSKTKNHLEGGKA